MQHLLTVWNALTPGRRLVVAGASVAVFAAVLLLARMAASPGLSLLYAGLDPAAAGEVVAALEQRGIVHEVRGGAIYVDSGARDSLRMSLAAEGLPANGIAGYEILDGLSGFGTTSQMFDAAYWRAKEGELARTIVAAPQIRSARVHIANPVSRAFGRDAVPSASVTVTTAAGGLGREQAEAFRHLVASAVTGLAPGNVSIIDSDGGLILSEKDGPGGAARSDIRAAALKANVERLLEARVGRGNAVVEVSIDTVTDRETVVERRFDPESRVAISTETVETAGNEQNTGASNVTVASNLPAGDADSRREASRQNSETRERVNYEVSETQREVVRGPGTVRRLGVAVLVDGIRETAPDGTESWTPRSDEELAALEELVKSAVGFDANRGDVVTLKTMAFTAPAALGTAAAPGLIAALGLDVMSILQIAIVSLVALALGLFVVRPILSSEPPPALAELAPPAPDEAISLSAPADGTAAGPAAGETPLIEDDPVARLRNLIESRQEDTAEVLRNWIASPEENA